MTATVVVGALAACDTGSPGAAPSSSTSVYSASSSSSSAPSATPVAAPDTCGTAQLDRMTLRQKLAQMVVVGVTDAGNADAIVRSEQIGGVFIGSWTDKSILTSGQMRQISARSPIPLMVTVDQEGGRVSRLSSVGIDSPSARELAQTQTPAQVRALAESIGNQLKRLGITVDFAPDADVSSQPADEVIGDRSFSDDPAVVIRYAEAFAEGLRAAGIMPVYKHFPGHGHGSGDSHLGVVRTPPLSSLRSSDLVPYQTLLRQPGVDRTTGVMVGHLIVPGLTGPETPASISARAIGMLRNGQQYGGPPFNGVVFSDDLSGMAAISERYPIEQAAVMAIRAGSDVALWLSTDRVPSVLDAMERAVARKQLTEDRVNRSVVRILRAKGVLTC